MREWMGITVQRAKSQLRPGYVHKPGAPRRFGLHMRLTTNRILPEPFDGMDGAELERWWGFDWTEDWEPSIEDAIGAIAAPLGWLGWLEGVRT